MKFGLVGLALGATAASVRNAGAAPNAHHAVQGSGGAAGGGVVTVDSGDAQFLFLGTRLIFEDSDEPEIFGQFQWLGTDGTRIESIEITSYGPIEGEPEEDRELKGIATMNGEGRFAFTVCILDGGKLGEGLDTLSLTVGPEETGTPAATPAPVFTAEGIVTAGDIQLVSFVVPDA